MNMGPSGPSPPGMGPPPGMGGPPPGMGGPPPGMSSMGPPPPGMVPHPSGMVPPGMPPGMQMMGMGPFGGPPSMPPFPPNGMPPMPVPYSNPPMPPQPNYAASPFAPSMVQALEPPPNGAIPLNSGGSMNKPAYIIKLPENWAIALDKERNAIYYYHRKTKHVQWHFPTVKDEEEEDDDEYDDNQLLADAKRKAEEEMMIQNVVTEPSILIGEDAGVADVKMSDISIGSIAADTSQPTITVPETGEPPPKKKREGLVTVNIISVCIAITCSLQFGSFFKKTFS
ncbi:unnamed protein product [Nesidiocoris tenuis]|uniref:WW domain-containing protein n=1 Tax=Nesidiocoris tenuis TaxID=355587 RepID=A0A6H5G3X7_9HEMI|nr:unnamed protein product [Nesidiocoris tenuis]